MAEYIPTHAQNGDVAKQHIANGYTKDHVSDENSNFDAAVNEPASTTKEFIVKHNGQYYDVKRFLKNHPGGVNLVQPFENKSITRKLRETNHSPSALYLLKEYQVGDGVVARDDIERDDIEKHVDWSKGMLSQVHNLGPIYNEWVASPVDRPLILFDNTFLESLTKSPWYIVPIVWIPIISALMIKGVVDYITHFNYVDITLIAFLVGYVLIGMLLWTLLEYSLHRWVFHMTPSGKSKAMLVLHFALHGLHHKVPFDDLRLVFPPVPAAILAYIGYALYTRVFPAHLAHIIGAGSLLGYLTYDMIHFYLHYGAPTENTYLYTMKRYHNQHHFVYHDSGFGISNRLWDDVFDTKINLRRLSKALKW